MINAAPGWIVESMESVDSKETRSTISSELVSLEAKETFEFSLAKTHKTHKTLISMRMILQKKLNKIVEVESYEARLVENGFRQRPEIDFDKTSTALISIVTIHLTLPILW